MWLTSVQLFVLQVVRTLTGSTKIFLEGETETL